MKIFASVLMKDIRVWLQAEVFVSENPILHFNERVKITPREKRRLATGRENVSNVSDFHARSRFARSTIPEEK